MANLKEVRNRIESVSSTQQITSAMKMVAASKLRRAQIAILKLRPYAAKMKEILHDLSSSLDDSSENVFSRQREIKKVLLIPISSNRGLCGAFNANIIKRTIHHINSHYPDQIKNGNVDLLCIGKKVSDFFSKNGYNVADTQDQLLDNLTFENVVPLANTLMDLFTQKEYDKIEIVYNQFKNAAVQILTVEEFLPVSPQDHGEKGVSKNQANYLFEPGKEEIVEELIPKTLKIQIYKALIDSLASEHGARMTAMHQASDNAGEILHDLKLTYNKARQAAITNEILEIVSGAEALKGK